MSFLRPSGEFLSNRETADFYDAELLLVAYETKPEIVKRLLPPPLEPAEQPIVFAFVANYPSTNFGVSYKEGALSLRSEFNGEVGQYYLAMPVTNDIALALGREVFGYPKKIAEIYFKHEKRNVEGWIERHGTRFFDVKAKLNGRLNAPDTMSLFMENIGNGKEIISVSYNYKHFQSPVIKDFDYHPRLIREEILLKPQELEYGSAEITLRSSESDPWGEVSVERTLGAVYLRGNNSMLKGNVIAELEPEKFKPYSFLKWDIEI